MKHHFLTAYKKSDQIFVVMDDSYACVHPVKYFITFRFRWGLWKAIEQMLISVPNYGHLLCATTSWFLIHTESLNVKRWYTCTVLASMQVSDTLWYG